MKNYNQEKWDALLEWMRKYVKDFIVICTPKAFARFGIEADEDDIVACYRYTKWDQDQREWIEDRIACFWGSMNDCLEIHGRHSVLLTEGDINATSKEHTSSDWLVVTFEDPVKPFETTYTQPYGAFPLTRGDYKVHG